jgi:hypothetical protein
MNNVVIAEDNLAKLEMLHEVLELSPYQTAEALLLKDMGRLMRGGQGEQLCRSKC